MSGHGARIATLRANRRAAHAACYERDSVHGRIDLKESCELVHSATPCSQLFVTSLDDEKHWRRAPAEDWIQGHWFLPLRSFVNANSNINGVACIRTESEKSSLHLNPRSEDSV